MVERKTAIAYLHILQGVLHYHERMMLPKSNKSTACQFCDMYSDALREAIRCLEQTHQIEGE